MKRKYVLAIWILFGLMLSSVFLKAQSAGDIVIVEIMKNPSTTAADDANGEWFEVFNATNGDIDINGWEIKDADSDSHIIDNGDVLLVPAMGVIVLGNSGVDTLNGNYAPDYVYSGITMANGIDEIILRNGGGEVIDEVAYNDDDFPDPNGSSMVFQGMDTEDNNDGSLWAEALERQPSYVGSEGDLGSPGSLGSDQQGLFVVGIEALALSESLMSISPNPADDIIHIVPHQNGQLILMNMDGRIVYENGVEAEQVMKLSLSNIASGFYLLRLYNEEITTTRKIIIR